MDWKLAFRMFFTYLMLFVIGGLLVSLTKYFASSEPFQFDFIRDVFMSLMFTVMNYYYQIDIGLALGIEIGDENYMKTSFSETVICNLNEEELIQNIKSSENIIEEVIVNGALVKKRKLRSLLGRVENNIQIRDEGKHLLCSIKTETKLPWLGLIRYNGLKSFTKIKEAIPTAKSTAELLSS